MSDEIMVTVIATGFNTRPKFTALSIEQSHSVNNLNQDVTKPKVERITQPKHNVQREEYAAPAPAEERSYGPAEERPRVERMTSRGTLTEKERASAFEARRNEVQNFERMANGAAHHAPPVRLTPRQESRNAPSGPRDLKDFDQPAYLRRGVNLPQTDVAENHDEMETVPQRENLGTRQQEQRPEPKHRDDRPTFLRRIMD
jgi:hypothetical protein